ncbi:hypothetical protein EN828_12125 [Mesorhizobium sp. M2D.F.Ca.ET.185.01.1.1]|uniref:hypothetical protein n=1 Tax=unclassified Mesorhizobium TaxID=325217 RepID=UPI000FC9FF7C|nr:MULTISPECIES: hypothetical protein [unclassified Mesorhizobium]TGP81018.1 hypothetical protein EN870_10905 [bacterium M00.F.Ca.ET.227.01.1.1]TGP90801.1 hypothetical protein EN864_18775 [bacterium M00.F.Ca.ET.221.01.1.1]TGP97480.1 hypothetical protein EN865_12545 [bacterium M00.F.Ca.ET.222.01.1.1]TGT73234.1 hypothetical protein EN802_15455 [bacterium M00.F.Ca.ET.159.01.1.1]TGT84103.1 hypothetical protein EN800_14085 [bacterium M00.F.Ca.ET.157.01.1.1]TGU07981.1 hypothetical protein EN806_320
MQRHQRIGWPSLAAILVLSVIITTTAIAKPFTYVNARFGQSCTFPDEVFNNPMPEPENGDGQQWLSADGAELTCSGINNLIDETPRSFVDEETSSTEPGYKVTYSKTGKNWAVLSGTKDGKIFYERRLFGKDGVIRTVFIEYPLALKAKYDPLAGAIAKSLRGP